MRAELEVIGAATPKKRRGKGRNMKWEEEAADRRGGNGSHLWNEREDLSRKKGESSGTRNPTSNGHSKETSG